MAEGGGTEREALDKLKGELTCPVCLGVYQDPRQLPCQHVLCAVSCLSDLLKKPATIPSSVPNVALKYKALMWITSPRHLR